MSVHLRCIWIETCLFLKSEGTDADIGGEDDLDAKCLNLTSRERQISDDEGKASLSSAYQEEFVHEADQTSEESFNTEASEKEEDSGDFIGFICELQSKFRFIRFLYHQTMFLNVVFFFDGHKSLRHTNNMGHALVKCFQICVPSTHTK